MSKVNTAADDHLLIKSAKENIARKYNFVMNRLLLLCLLILFPAFIFSQVYNPIAVTGFNEDVIAEGTGNSSLTNTSKEMDALVPSNYIITTKQFAAANSIPSAYGIPDNGTIVSGSRTYQLAPLGSGAGLTNNVVFLFKNDVAVLTLTTPASYTNLSFLGTATEGAATINIRVNYADGSNQIFNNKTYEDWVGGASPILQGFGRVKRQNGPFPAGSYEHAPIDPRLYSIDVPVSCSKLVSSIMFSNVSGGTGASSNRAFIFAISGARTNIPTSPVLTDVAICSNGSATLAVQSPSPFFIYTWFTTPTGGTSFFTGTSYTTPVITSTTTYYVQAMNSGGCASTRTPVTVTVSPPPATPVIPTIQVCSGQSGTLTITSPEPGATYNWYTSSAGGTPIYTGTAYTTPPVTATTTYYVQGTNAAGCTNTTMATATIDVAAGLTPPVVPNVQICSGQSATVSVTTPQTGITYKWFTTNTGGTPFYTGTAYTTPVLTADITYYVQSENAAGCISTTRTAVTVSILPPLSAPTASNVTVCKAASAVLSVTNPDPALTYSWYISASATTPVATGTTYTTPPITNSTTYYLEASNSGGCVSTRTAVTVTVSPSPPAPTVPPVQICRGQTATLAVDSPQPGFTYNWYTSSTGGALIYTGTTYTTAPLTTTTTYWVEAVNATGCVGPHGPAVANVAPAPVAPAMTDTAICAGQTVTLTINSPQPGVIYNWFTAATGGTAIYTGVSYTTGVLTNSVSFYVEAQTTGGCISSTRSQVNVTVLAALSNPVVTDVTICTSKTAGLSVTGPNPALTYNWYVSQTATTPIATGITFTSPVLTSTTTYYIESVNATGCKSLKVPVTVTVLAPVVNPTVPAVEICNSQTATVTVTNAATGITYSWYTSSTGGTAIYTGTTYTTPVLTANTTYYVQGSNSAGCVSGFTAAPVTVNPTVAPPAAPAVSICYNTTATLNITAPVAGYTYNWYPSATATSPSATGVTFITPALLASTGYYLEAITNKGCVSTRTIVPVNVAPDFAAPLANSTSVCIGQLATLSIGNAGTGITYKWYTSAVGGGVVYTGSTYVISAVTADLTLYVQGSSSAGCVSTFTPVTVTALAVPTAPAVTAPTICAGQATLLSVTNPEAGITYNWFTTSSGGISIATGTTYQTGTLSSSVAYYVEPTSSAGCVSRTRTAATVTILPFLPAPVLKGDTICPKNIAGLSVVNPQLSLTYNWYTTPAGGTSITTATAYSTGYLSSAATWYVEAVNAGGCTSARTPVTAVVKIAPKASFTATPIAGCDPLKVVFRNTTQNAASYLWSFGDGQNTTDTNSSHLYSAGNYNVSLVATGNGCADTVFKPGLITVVRPPKADFTSVPGTSADVQLSFADFTFFNRSTDADTYTWKFGDGTTSGSTNPKHKYVSTGEYTVTLYARNRYGCSDSLSRSIYKIIPDSTINIPNAFSPNNDGINDTWIIRGISGYPSPRVSIYNRWGSLVYESISTYKPWNGTYKGGALQTGTFYYIIQLKPEDKPMAGWLMLVK